MKLLLLILVGAFLVVSTAMYAEAKTYKTNSYTVNVPNGCKTEDEQNRFSDDAFFKCSNLGGAEGDIAFEMAGSPYTGSDDDLPDQLMTVITDKWGTDVKEVERGTNKYIINNQTAPYIQATFKQEYTGLFGLPTKSEDWAYMVVGIKTGDDMLYAQYKNKVSKFDKQLPIFEKVLNSIKTANSSSDSETSTAESNNSDTSGGGDFQKTKRLCDTVTTQSEKDLCGKLLT